MDVKVATAKDDAMTANKLTLPFYRDVDAETPLQHPERIRELRIKSADHLKPTLPGQFTEVRDLWIEVEIEALPSWLRKFTKLRELTLVSRTLKRLPSWLVEFQDLRDLQIYHAASLKSLPKNFWELPRFERLYLRGTSVSDLPGIENSSSYFRELIGGESIEPKIPEIADRLSEVRSVKTVTVGPSTIELERDSKLRIPTGSRKADIQKRAKLLPTLPRGFDCSGIDLSGAVFEDLDVDVDLSRANLDNTTWRRCQFTRSAINGASASAASFEDCAFHGELRKLKARGLQVRRTELPRIEASSLQDAVITEPPEDSFLRLTNCRLRNARIEGLFSTPNNGGYMSFEGADLSGARVELRLTEKAAARVAGSSVSHRWKEAKTSGAITDSKTEIVYAPLQQSKKKQATMGSVATSEGTLCGINAACWFVVADAEQAQDWKGSVLDENYEELPGTDFSRVAKARKGSITVGEHEGVLADVGDCGCSELWKDGDSWCLVDAILSEDLDPRSERGKAVLGSAVAQLKAKKTKRVGKFRVTSGCMTLLLPSTGNPFSQRQITKVLATGKVLGVKGKCDALLVPTANGEYIVQHEQLDHEDDLGRFMSRVRIKKVGSSKPSKASKASKSPSKSKSPKPSKVLKSRANKASKRLTRLEFIEGKSSKFWEASVVKSALHVRYGRIGSEGTTKLKEFASTADAIKAQEKLIASKRKKGYEEV